MKNRATLLAAAALALALGVGVNRATLAKPVSFKLPPETSTFAKSTAEGYQKAETFCGVCHSRDYVSTQPRGKGKDFWTAEVTKMVKVYGAPIPEGDWAALAEYLAANY